MIRVKAGRNIIKPIKMFRVIVMREKMHRIKLETIVMHSSPLAKETI